MQKSTTNHLRVVFLLASLGLLLAALLLGRWQAYLPLVWLIQWLVRRWLPIISLATEVAEPEGQQHART